MSDSGFVGEEVTIPIRIRDHHPKEGKERESRPLRSTQSKTPGLGPPGNQRPELSSDAQRPTKVVMKAIGKVEDDKCECGEIQNAVQLRRCRFIGDGKGRTLEEVGRDQGWYRAVAGFLH